MNVLFDKENKTAFLDLKPTALFTYSTENLSKKDKVKFFYALNGRNGKSGLLAEYNSTHLGITTILVPVKFKFSFISFLRKWSIKFEIREMLVE